MDHPVFDHKGPWTEDAYLALEGNDGRIEVVDGTLLIGPDTSPQRARAMARLGEVVRSALPGGLTLRSGVRLRLSLDSIVVPDFVITNSAVLAEAGVLDAADTLMVIEVVGRDHGAADRSFKPQLYARSRIPYSLLVDHDAPFAVAEMIISGRYHEYATAGPGERLTLDEPFRLTVNLAEVTARESRPAASEPAAS